MLYYLSQYYGNGYKEHNSVLEVSFIIVYDTVYKDVMDDLTNISSHRFISNK